MTSRLLSVDDALEIIAAQVHPLGSERLPLAAAHGRFLAQPLQALIDLPPFTNSAMDGFAVRAADTPGALTLVGESAAGSPFDGTLAAGQAVRISTGAVMPDGADSVAIVERVTVDGGTLIVPDQIAAEANVRHAGSDARQGQTIVPTGTRVMGPQIGAAAAIGVGTVQVGRRPSVAMIATGSELTAPGEPLAPGAIYDSNGPMMRALIEHAGAAATVIPAPDDTLDSVRRALAQALTHDVVITTGGVSVGPHDLVRQVGSELGISELFWGIRMRPGKPLSFGVHGRKLVFGIPGNPVSALVCFEIFVRPALEALQGAAHPRPPFQTRVLAQDVQPNRERDDLIRVRLTGDGQLLPLQGQMSHQLTVSAQADGLARIPCGETVLPAGSSVAYLPLGR